MLESPVVVFGVTDDKLRSEAESARGVAPADWCSTAAHLVLPDECLLWLYTKPSRDGAISVLGMVAPGCGGSWRSSVAVVAGGKDKHRIQGLVCNFYFVLVPMCK